MNIPGIKKISVSPLKGFEWNYENYKVFIPHSDYTASVLADENTYSRLQGGLAIIGFEKIEKQDKTDLFVGFTNKNDLLMFKLSL